MPKINKTGKPRKYRYDTGYVIGRLTMIERTDRTVCASPVCVWKCECGKTCERTLVSVKLSQGIYKSSMRTTVAECTACGKTRAFQSKKKHIANYRRDIISAWLNGTPNDETIAKYKITKQRLFQIITRYASAEVVQKEIEEMTRTDLIAAILKQPIPQQRRIFLTARTTTKQHDYSRAESDM